MQVVLMICALGVLGTLCRYGIDQMLPVSSTGFPTSIFVINVLGSALSGLIFSLAERGHLSTQVQIPILVGFCGAFTTFSTYALQSLLLFEKGKAWVALAYLGLSPVPGVLAAAASIMMARRFLN